MADDLIKEALIRFQYLVEETSPHAQRLSGISDGDRRLARLAIKKYNKAMNWRLRAFISEEPKENETCHGSAV